MIRRTFFQLLSGAVIPIPDRHSTKPRNPVLPCPSGEVPALSGNPDPEWLTEWLRLPRIPVLAEDLPEIPDSHERELVTQILQRIRSGNPLNFQYFGGSEPGKTRQVLPVLLFTTAVDDLPCGVGEPNPMYLLAWCLLRNAPRTFRLDRIGACHPTSIPPRTCSPKS